MKRQLRKLLRVAHRVVMRLGVKDLTESIEIQRGRVFVLLIMGMAWGMAAGIFWAHPDLGVRFDGDPLSVAAARTLAESLIAVALISAAFDVARYHGRDDDGAD